MMRSRARLRIAALGFLLAGAPPAFAQSDAGALAEGLVRLRGEVEQLNTELELLREEQRTTLASLNAQKAELSGSTERQQLALREARQKLEAQQAATADAGVTGDALTPVLLDATAALEAQIKSGLPFKVEERLAELASFRTQIENGSLPPQRGVNRLWAFYEDEFRLTRENGLHTQTIALGDERVLADVAKLGNMLMYFRTQDGRLGQARSGAQGWQFVEVTDDVPRAQIATLFEALGKQIRQGYFELPLAATAGAAP